MIKIAKYLRLSLEDECLQDESTSILSQRLIIDSFIREHEEFNDALTEEYIDDGYSGTNMERPAMESLLSKIKTGEVDVIIVKDLSRFSRDYIELGKYLEKIFPFLGIRFIAINDNYDSIDTDGGIGSIDSNFKTLINDYYSKDTSEKILSNYRAQTKKGKAISWAPSFGYMKDPKDKHQFLVDEVAAKTVKKIFEWALKGWSIHKITRQLSQDGDITPAERKKMLTNMDYKHKQKTGNDKTYRWNVSTVSRITRDKEYTRIISHEIKFNIFTPQRRLYHSDTPPLITYHFIIILCHQLDTRGNSIALYRYGVLHFWGISFFYSRRSRNMYIGLGYRFPI